MARIIKALALLAFMFAITGRADALTWDTFRQIHWADPVSTLDSILSSQCTRQGIDSLGIKRYADSLSGMSCELILVADGDWVDALLIRFHVSEFKLKELTDGFTRVNDELKGEYGKAVETKSVAYSKSLSGYRRVMTIWADSVDQVLLLQDRDSYFSPLLDLVFAGASFHFEADAGRRKSKADRDELVAWLDQITPAVLPPHLLPPPKAQQPTLEEQQSVEEMPVRLRAAIPHYPEAAAYASKEGTVWVKALVDERGNVADVRLAKPSNSGFDFESPVIAAALKCVYSPARLHGKAIPVWVTYPVEFRIH